VIQIDQGKTKAMPRICFLVETFYPSIGGCEIHGRQLVEGFLENGVESFVITRRLMPESKQFERLGNMQIFRIPPVGKSQFIRRWIMIFPCLVHLIRMRRRYNLIFVYGFRTLGIPAVIVSKLFGKQTILRAANSGEMTGQVFVDGLKRFNLSLSSGIVRFVLWLRNWLIKKADVFVSVSSEITAELVANGISPGKIKYIPNGVDIRRFYPIDECKKREIRKTLGIPPDKTVAVFIGRLVYWKGLPLLVRVWKEILSKHPDTLLLVVGPTGCGLDSCEEEVKAFVRDNSLKDSIYFTGGVNNVHEYLQASDMFVLPSANEGFSNALVEAMACGLSVISTFKDAAADVIQNGKNGISMSVGNFSELYEAIETLLTNKPLAISLGRAALQTVRENYSKDKVIDEYIGLFIQMQNG
jgi:glycosyltransferase involved in cell wall biosynthesis